MQLQQTLRKSYLFEGKGLHTGRVARMTVSPAPADTGIVFKTTNLFQQPHPHPHFPSLSFLPSQPLLSPHKSLSSPSHSPSFPLFISSQI